MEHRAVNGQVKTAEALSSKKLVLEPVFSKMAEEKKKKYYGRNKGRILCNLLMVQPCILKEQTFCFPAPAFSQEFKQQFTN